MSRDSWTLPEAQHVKVGGAPPYRSAEELDLARWALLGRTPEEGLPYLNGRPETGTHPITSKRSPRMVTL
jgi:hypothetical protein